MPQFHKEDLKFIEKEVTRVVRQELKQRTVFPVDTNFDRNAREIGFDIFDIHGSAKILAHGASAKDIPFVGESKRRKTQTVHTIADGIRFEKAERDAVEASRRLGRGASFNLDAERPETARRFIMEKEAEVIFKGAAEFDIKGVFDNSFFGTNLGTKEFVAEGATGVNAAAKRRWINKTPPEILIDIRRSIQVASKEGLFTGGEKWILLPFAQFFQLTEPFSEDSQFTLMDWVNRTLKEQIRIEWFQALKAENNEVNDDLIFCYTKDRKLIKFTLTQDMSLLRPVFDILETSEQVLMEKTGGMMIKHPASLYVGKGI